jgi:hypothetical protein
VLDWNNIGIEILGAKLQYSNILYRLHTGFYMTSHVLVAIEGGGSGRHFIIGFSSFSPPNAFLEVIGTLL